MPDFDFHNCLYVSFLKQASVWTCSWMFWISAKSFNKFAKNRGHFFAGIPFTLLQKTWTWSIDVIDLRISLCPCSGDRRTLSDFRSRLQLGRKGEKRHFFDVYVFHSILEDREFLMDRKESSYILFQSLFNLEIKYIVCTSLFVQNYEWTVWTDI